MNEIPPRRGRFLGWLKPVARPEAESRPRGLPPRPEHSGAPYRYRTRIEVTDRDGRLMTSFTGEGSLNRLNLRSADEIIRAALEETVNDYEELG